MTTGNFTVGLAFGLFTLLVPVGFARAEPPSLEPAAPLTVPTPAAPKLRLPEMAPPPPSMMLDQIRPLRVPPRSERPTLNSFPGAEVDSDEQSDDGASANRNEEPRIRLQHR